jgi:single-stranded DNA-binding protein
VVMEGVNHLVVSGVLEHNPTIRYREDGTCMCRGTIRVDELSAQGVTYKTFIPFEAYTKVAETVGGRRGGDVLLLQGKVFWRKYHTKAGEEKSGLALLVQKCSVLVSASVSVASVSSHAKESSC